MALIPGSSYDIFITSAQAVFVGETSDPNNPPTPIPGDFNLEVVLNNSGTGSFNTAPGYQALAIMATPGGAVFTALHGDYGIVDTGAGGNKIILGDGNESLAGAAHDTLQGGSGNNQFIDGSAGHQLIFLGGSGNELIWSGFGDTIGGGFGANITIGGAAGDTIGGPASGNQFVDATAGSQWIDLGTGGNVTVWGGANDTILGGANANVTVGGAPGDTIFGHGLGIVRGFEFIDASRGGQYINLRVSENLLIWGGPSVTIDGGGPNVSIAGASGETITAGASFVDGSRGNQSIVAGGFNINETIWGGAGDTIDRGSAINLTVGGAPGDTIWAGHGNWFIDASGGSQSVLGSFSSDSNVTIWGAATDTIFGGTAGNTTIGGAAGETIVGGSGNTFIDASAGNESIVPGNSFNETIWGGPNDTVQGSGFSGVALIGFAGGNETFRTNAALSFRGDSISGFNQAGGDRVFLGNPADTPDYVVGTATTDSAGNTTVTLHNHETITFIGISSIDSSFFTTG